MEKTLPIVLSLAQVRRFNFFGNFLMIFLQKYTYYVPVDRVHLKSIKGISLLTIQLFLSGHIDNIGNMISCGNL